MKNILTVGILGFCALLSTAFTAPDAVTPPDTRSGELPKVFLIGEYTDAFDKLSAEYSYQLYDACDQDLSKAFSKWTVMMLDVQQAAEAQGIDIRGLRLWLKVFWAKDGSIEHIAYFLKPNSRNIETRKLTAFLTAFANNYVFPLEATQKYSHYASASFPIYVRRDGNSSSTEAGTN